MRYNTSFRGPFKGKALRRIKQAAAIVLAAAAIALGSGMSAAAAQKSETVYARLDQSGKVEHVYVVNRLIGSYTDYGSYTDIKNLSTTSVPSIEGDRISFPDEYVEGGLYYQGTAVGELPIVVSIRWYLDGKDVLAENLSGATGRLKIHIQSKPNVLCNENVRSGLATQISVPMNMKKAENISSNGASTAVVGSTATVSHVILPGESGELVIEADIRDFEMDAITIALVNSQWGAFTEDFDALEDGIGEMLDGAWDMADGMSELKSGAGALTKGAKELNDGLGRLAANGSPLTAGMSQYGDGLSEYFSGAEQIAPASASIKSGLQEMARKGAEISGGISGISVGLNGISGSSGDLKALAQSLLTSEDESVRTLAAGTLGLIGSVESVSGNLSNASGGLDAYMAGVSQAALDYAEFDDAVMSLAQGAQPLRAGFAELRSGVADYTDGVSQSAQGMQRMYRYLKRLPSGMQELMDAQEEFKSGLSEIKDGINSSLINTDQSPPVSFASPYKNKPQSVQYVLMTSGIEKPKIEKQPAENGNGKTVADRFIDLFR